MIDGKRFTLITSKCDTSDADDESSKVDVSLEMVETRREGKAQFMEESRK